MKSYFRNFGHSNPTRTRWRMHDRPRLQKIDSRSPSTCNRGNVLAEIGPSPCRVGNKNAPRGCFLAIAANGQLLICKTALRVKRTRIEDALGCMFNLFFLGIRWCRPWEVIVYDCIRIIIAWPQISANSSHPPHVYNFILLATNLRLKRHVII